MEVDQVAATANPSANQGAPAQQSLPFVEKYRPAGLGDIISHTEIVTTSKLLINALILSYSSQVHWVKEYAAFALLWATRHRQDILHASDRKGDLRRQKLQAHDARVERIRWPWHQRSQRSDQELLQYIAIDESWRQTCHSRRVWLDDLSRPIRTP